jgi:hypothetical protein
MDGTLKKVKDDAKDKGQDDYATASLAEVLFCNHLLASMAAYLDRVTDLM